VLLNKLFFQIVDLKSLGRQIEIFSLSNFSILYVRPMDDILVQIYEGLSKRSDLAA
jgi:hypothetical protein